MRLFARQPGAFRIVGGTRAERERVAEILAEIPAPIAAAASRRLVTVRLDAHPERYGAEVDDGPGAVVAGTYVQDFALALVNPAGRFLPWTTWHEVAHGLDAALAACGDRKWSTGTGFAWWTDHVAREDFPSSYATTNPAENFAERFAEWMTAATGIGAGDRALCRGWERRTAAFRSLVESLADP